MIEFALKITDRCKDNIVNAKKCGRKKGIVENMIIAELEECIRFTQTQCSLADRRVILDEKIPHDDKIFSYFEPHTELINRGKSPYPIKFGHRVLVIQDRAGFVLKYLIMDHTTDDEVLLPAMKDLQEQYGSKIISASFDKGFWSPQNLIELA